MMNYVDMSAMNRNQLLTWHYVMDIHEPDHFWYSTYMGYLGETF